MHDFAPMHLQKCDKLKEHKCGVNSLIDCTGLWTLPEGWILPEDNHSSAVLIFFNWTFFYIFKKYWFWRFCVCSLELVQAIMGPVGNTLSLLTMAHALHRPEGGILPLVQKHCGSDVRGNLHTEQKKQKSDHQLSAEMDSQTHVAPSKQCLTHTIRDKVVRRLDGTTKPFQFHKLHSVQLGAVRACCSHKDWKWRRKRKKRWELRSAVREHNALNCQKFSEKASVVHGFILKG